MGEGLGISPCQSPGKSCSFLRDGSVLGQPESDFGAICGGALVVNLVLSALASPGKVSVQPQQLPITAGLECGGLCHLLSENMLHSVLLLYRSINDALDQAGRQRKMMLESASLVTPR